VTEVSPSSVKPRLLFLKGMVLAIVAIALDQATKGWILEDVMIPPRVIEITSNFNLVLGWNRGVSFGLFNQDSTYGPHILTGVALVIVLGLSIWLWKSTTHWSAWALGLVIGGAIGNVIDRIQYGAVVDFLDFHAFGYHWPAFNVADTAICIGAGLLILESLFIREESS
jgi:signal peptidase II